MAFHYSILHSICIIALSLASGGCSREDDADAGVRVVDVWAHHGQVREHDAMERIVTAFNEAHAGEGLRVEIEFFPDRQYADKVSIAAASRTLPDVLDIDGPHVGPWAADGVLQPIGDHVTPEMADDFLPTIIQQGTYEGELYALGAFESALVIYYNRAITTKANVQPPSRVAQAWTWAEFVDALERVRPHATIALSLHMNEQSNEWITYAFSPLIWSNGGRLIDTEAARVVGAMNGPAAIQAVRRWKNLFETGLAEPSSPNPNPFADGLAAFDWTGHWLLPTFEARSGLEFGVMPVPRMGDEPVAPSGSWCWGLSRTCGDVDAAWKVIKWFVHPEHGVKPIVEANGAVPARRSAFTFFPEYDRMPRRLFREQLEQIAQPRPRTAVYQSLSNEFAQALRDIALGAQVSKRLTEAAESVQRTLDRRRGS